MCFQLGVGTFVILVLFGYVIESLGQLHLATLKLHLDLSVGSFKVGDGLF